MAVELAGSVRLPVLSKRQVYDPALRSTLSPEPIKLPTAKLPCVVILPVPMANVTFALLAR